MILEGDPPVPDFSAKLAEWGAVPSISEDRGLALLESKDKVVFSPGISTAGFAEIRMAKQDPERKIIATTIDQKGLEFTHDVVAKAGVGGQIEAKNEDLNGPWEYAPESFDFIFARLVLQYLTAPELDRALANFHSSLKKGGKMFVVVRGEKGFDRSDPNITYDPVTHFTTYPTYAADGSIEKTTTRYLHTLETMREHLAKAGFVEQSSHEYSERLSYDYERRKINPVDRHLIEIVVTKE